MATSPKAEVLLVEPDLGDATRVLEGLPGARFAVERVDTAEKAYNVLESGRVQAVVSVLKSGPVDGIRLMNVAHGRDPDLCAILVADAPDIELATEAMRLGAYDVQTKPLNVAKLEAVIERGLSHQALVQEHFRLQRRLDERFGLASMIGQSRPMATAYGRVRRAAPSRAPIILAGEPGTGKDLVAQVIHSLSENPDGPLVKVDASHGAESLLSRELFGFAAGVFDESDTGRGGYVEAADGGTLYLDRLRECDPIMSEQLIAATESGSVQRLGDPRPHPVSFRLLVSVEPEAAMEDRTRAFLETLTSRLGAVTIELPPLRSRQVDISPLARHFLEQIAQDPSVRARTLSPRVLEVFEHYAWPGNVRELREVVHSIALKWPSREVLDIAQLPPALRDSVAPGDDAITIAIGTKMADVERRMIEETLRANSYDKEATAKALGIGLRTLYRKLKQYDNA